MIEKISGQSYYDYMQQHIFKIAGMNSSGYTPIAEEMPVVAVGYTKAGAGAPWSPNTDTLAGRASSAGGGESTVNDLFRFAEAFRNHKFLDPKLSSLLTTSQVDISPDSHYGYGFEVHTVGGRLAVGHSGGAPGMNAEFDLYEKEGYVVIVLSNFDPPTGERLARYMGERLE